MKPQPDLPLSWRKPVNSAWFLLWQHIGDQQKRMCVLSSLYARLTECECDDVKDLCAFNETMGLTRDSHAMRFPALVAPLLWKTVKPVEQTDLTDVDHYIKRLLRKTPCWLVYGDLETRWEDIRRVLDFCRSGACNNRQVVQ